MNVEIKRLYEERAGLVKQFRDGIEAAEKENRGFSSEEKVNSDALDSQIVGLKDRIDKLERAEAIEAESVPLDRPIEKVEGTETEETRALALQGWMRSQCDIPLDNRHLEACRITGLNPASRTIDMRLGNTSQVRQLREKRAGMSLTDALGGYTVPTGFVQNFETALLTFGGPRQVADVIRTETGNDLVWPTGNDTGNKGALLSEETTIGSTVNPTVGAKTFKAYKMSSKLIQISPELLQDSAFDMASQLGAWLGERIGRIEADYFTFGTGSSQPEGCVYGATSGIKADSATAITLDEIIELIHTVDPAYRPGAKFMMHDLILSYIRRIKNGDGIYYWQPSVTLGEPDRLFGYPVVVNNSMESSISSDHETILFGDFSKFKIRDVAQIRLRRLVERYADTDQEGFVAFHRTDSGVIDAGTNPLKYFEQA